MFAFVFNRTDFREKDQLVTLYTWEKGKMETLIRGVKKITSKNSAYLEPIFLVDAEVVPGKELNYLIKAVPFYCYKNIASDFDKLRMLQIAFKWVSVLTHPGHRDAQLFLLIKSWLEFLDEITEVAPSLLYAFLGNLFVSLGFSPQLDVCSVCGVKENLSGFYPAGGGVICKACLIIKKQKGEKAYPVRAADLNCIRILFSNNWDEVNKNNNEISNRLVFLFAQYHSEKKLVKFVNI